MRTLIFALVLAAGLTACSTPAVVSVKERLPQNLLSNCDYAEPPESNKYKAASWSEKEKMWNDTYDQFLLNTSGCNSRLNQARKLNTEQ